MRGKKTGWRLGGKNAPRWVQAPATPAVKRTTRDDLALLQRTFEIGGLPSAHPLRQLWDLDVDGAPLAEARFEFHHLAADVRAIAGVRGAGRLVEAMIRDLAGYSNYRYELRIAGSVGRSSTQRLVSLGGKDDGPDIEVVTRSGHIAGLACYRASSTPPSLLESREKTRELAMRLGDVIARTPIVGHCVGLVLEFDRFPISEAAVASAVTTFEEVWRRPSGAPDATGDGVKVRRESASRLPFDRVWDVRVDFSLPVPSREKYRISNKIRDKLVHENAQWASSYAGVPILFVEESDFCVGLHKDEIDRHLQPGATHAFQGILATQQFFANGFRGARHRIEQIHFTPRLPGVGIDLGIETFGENIESFGDGHGVIWFAPNHAHEVWRLCSGLPPLGFASSCVQPLGVRLDFHRLPVPLSQKITVEQLEPLIKKIVPGLADGAR